MEFIKGMDISMLKELEDLGASYYDEGVKKDLFQILKKYGVNLIRLRIWNNPYDDKRNPYGGGTNDFHITKQLARRAHEKGMDILLDYHYSDFWTDPKKQLMPKAWAHKSREELAEEVYQYTYHTLLELKQNGMTPQMVQIGNEITGGLLWPIGKLPDTESMAMLLKAGIKAAKAVDKNIKIILHLDNGGNNEIYREWFDNILPFGLDFDMIGLSYYPYWNGTVTELKSNMDDISRRYQKEVIVLETAYGFSTDSQGSRSMIFSEELSKNTPYPPSPEGQAAFMKDLMTAISSVNDGYGAGFVYWEPEWIAVPGTSWALEAGQKYINDMAFGGNPWANQALFDFEGNVLPALTTIKQFHINHI